MDMKPPRDGYGEGLLELGKTNPQVLVLDADLSTSTRTDWFMKEFPERFFDIGIAEQDMLGTAAGLALAGKIPFVTTYGVFVAGRAWDQIRTTISYGELNVKIAGAHGGISVGADGATHQALEEITLMRVLPNMTLVVPCDAIQTKKATIALASLKGPAYLRFGREATPVFTKENDPFEIGKAITIKSGNDLTIIACGPIVYEALQAAESLEHLGISTRVINMHTVKPLDEEIIIKAAQETKAIVTAEEHQVLGGLGGAVAEVLVKNHPVPVEMIGIQDTFGESGTPEELAEKYGLTSQHILEAAQKVLKRK